uniref:Uncharacterized protein n=1 Tax=Cercocebus atys TaxID=9531 RepID=A0A2K5L3Y8_CERAT
MEFFINERDQLNPTVTHYNSVVYFIPLESYLLCFSAHRPSLLFYQYIWVWIGNENQHSHP